ncbi:MAG: hypothetical protein NTW03_17375, partial [Verrucomicrobia bacterium]|nr:hypothetical protein [Verrucomicrobiota bacterium]
KGATRVLDLLFDHTQTGDPQGSIDWWKGRIPGQSTGVTVKYKVALFKDGISPISDADSAKVCGLTQFALTNFNPQTATVWLHNNLNPNHTRIGLEEGFHVVRGRVFLTRDGKSSVFNTFVQTFYYDAQPPAGVIAYPGTNETLRSQQYGVVVRADATVTGVEYNIMDGSSANDDIATGQPNGNGASNGAPVWARATSVAPLAQLTAQYSNLPQEFRFNYLAVPSASNATITVRLKKASSAVYTNRYTLLTRLVPTQAPAQTLEVAYPAFDGQVLSLAQNSSYTIVARFSDILAANVTNFLITIDNAAQPRFKPDGSPNYYFQDQTPGDG